MIMKNNSQKITLYVIFLFLCCYFMRLFAFPNMVTVAAGAGICLILLIQQKRIRIDIGICLLTLTMVSYYVIVNGVRGLFFMILYIPLILYVLAEYAVFGIPDHKNNESQLKLLAFALVAGFAVYGILDSYMWYAGYVVPGTRRWQDFWTGEIVPGTQHTAYYLPVLAVFVPAVLYFKEHKIKSIVLIFLTAFFGYSSLATRSRMSVVIFALAACLQAVMFVCLESKKVKELMGRKVTWLTVLGLLAVIAAGVFFVKDTPVVTAFIENLGKGGGIFKNVRFSAQRSALSQLFVYPMGGRQMDLGREFCHNTWLDMANAGGIIPFFAFALFTLYSLWGLICFLVKKNISPETKMIMAGLYVAFFLYLSVEPALDASIHLVTPWIFVNGLIHGTNVRDKKSGR